MLKKLSLFLLITCIYTANADQLSEAIRVSDLQRVSSLLSEQSITEKQLIKYFDLAEQIIRTRREEAHLTQVTPIFEDSWATKYSRRAMFMFLGTSVFATPALFAIADYYRVNKCRTKEYLCGITGVANLGGFFASSIVAIVCKDKAMQQYRNKCFALYHDSVRIKELLYDYELSLSGTK